MKVDLRDNMLDKKNPKRKSFKKNKKIDWKSFFSVLVGSKKIEKSNSLEQLVEKTKLLNENSSFSKVESLGIGQAEFQPKKNTKNSLEKNSNFLKNPIQQDYQNNLDFKYEKSYYIENFPKEILIKWQGPDYEIYSKSKRWYITVGLILSVIVIYAVLKNSPLMAIVFILIGIVGYLYLEREPKIMDFGISHHGVVAGNDIYSFDDMKSFWIFYEPPHTQIISLHMKEGLMPHIHIPLHQVDPVEVREKLMKFIPEIEQEKGLVDVLERLLQL